MAKKKKKKVLDPVSRYLMPGKGAEPIDLEACTAKELKDLAKKYPDSFEEKEEE